MEREMSAADFDDVGGGAEPDLEEEMAFSPAARAAAEDDERTGESNVRWRRPDLPPGFDPRAADLIFQWTAVDLMSGDALAVHPRGRGTPVPGAAVGPVPIIRYGINR